MWRFGSHAISGNLGPRSISSKPSRANVDCSDDEASLHAHREEGLECPICWKSFNIVENVPYVLWCGHTLCKNCVLGFNWAIMKFPSLPVQLPLFISCPWCNLLSFRLIYKGDLKFSRKNYFLLWMVESMNSGQAKFYSSLNVANQRVCPPNGGLAVGSNGNHHHNLRRIPQYMDLDDSPSSTNQPVMRANYLMWRGFTCCFGSHWFSLFTCLPSFHWFLYSSLLSYMQYLLVLPYCPSTSLSLSCSHCLLS